MRFRIGVLIVFAMLGSTARIFAQSVPAVSSEGSSADPGDREAEIRELRRDLDRISARLAVLESEGNGTGATKAAEERSSSTGPVTAPVAGAAVAVAPITVSASPAAASPSSYSASAAAPVLRPEDVPSLAFLRGTTLSFGVDGYYGYNFNQPLGRMNQLRAFDVTSNSFNLNQANVIVEHLPTTESRAGGRIDLQFGQATDTLQGSSFNEQRPEVWRNLFQVYGSYLAPVGSGVGIDFGKFASSLGNEGNYSKDQVTYSRSYSFDYLPFYHLGLRTNYNVTPKVNVAYWLVNGANDSEDLNDFKSQAFLFTLKPASTLTWVVNYYFGRETRDIPETSGALRPDGREHIFDTYATWQPTPKLTLIGEADFVVNRTYHEQQPSRVALGGFTARYALAHNWNLGGRTEYFDDRGGLFSGQTQSLKEATVSLGHTFAPGFLARAEYRRDWSNQKFFLSDTANAFEGAQTTATLGLVYWWGTKDGSW